MTNYITKIQDLADQLKNDPSVQLLNFNLFPAVTEAIIEERENELGYKLDHSITSFFKQTNGLQIRWINKNATSFSAEEHLFSEEPLYYLEPLWEGSSRDIACINILPFEDIFFGNWEEQEGRQIMHLWDDYLCDYDAYEREKTFLGRTYNEGEFRDAVRPFDLFSNFYATGFLLEEGESNPKVIIIEDQWAGIGTDDITTFEEYLHMIIDSAGKIRSRPDFFFKSL